jgi:hypothetical protein
MATTLSYHPLPLPPSANPKYFETLGRRVEGFDPANVSPEQMEEIKANLYKVRAALYILAEPSLMPALGPALQEHQDHAEAAVRAHARFRPRVDQLRPRQQQDGQREGQHPAPGSEDYPASAAGAADRKRQGAGRVRGIAKRESHPPENCAENGAHVQPQLKHPHHKTFHKSPVPDEEEQKGVTRFYRW